MQRLRRRAGTDDDELLFVIEVSSESMNEPTLWSFVFFLCVLLVCGWSCKTDWLAAHALLSLALSPVRARLQDPLPLASRHQSIHLLQPAPLLF